VDEYNSRCVVIQYRARELFIFRFFGRGGHIVFKNVARSTPAFPFNVLPVVNHSGDKSYYAGVCSGGAHTERGKSVKKKPVGKTVFETKNRKKIINCYETVIRRTTARRAFLIFVVVYIA